MAEVRYKSRTMTDVGKLDSSPEINETPFGDIYNLKRTYSIAMKLRRMRKSIRGFTVPDAERVDDTPTLEW